MNETRITASRGQGVSAHLEGSRNRDTPAATVPTLGQVLLSSNLKAKSNGETSTPDILVPGPIFLLTHVGSHSPCVSFKPVHQKTFETHGAAFALGPAPVAPCPSFVASCPPPPAVIVAILLLVVRPVAETTTHPDRPPVLPEQTSSIGQVVVGVGLGGMPCGVMAVDGGGLVPGPPPGSPLAASHHLQQCEASPAISAESPGVPLSWGTGQWAADQKSVQ